MDPNCGISLRRNRGCATSSPTSGQPEAMERALQIEVPAGHPATGRDLFPNTSRDSSALLVRRDQGNEEVF